ncbi:nucleoporin p58/p45-like [Protopterus annectens]|uniref:nucleoporin p58/p45-like n=1 Tax=Protopterus annectens TaxID=7888 RepID=UPI001CFAC9EE|nr:nucleoporin p58/p45-like [Protopterus annectens]
MSTGFSFGSSGITTGVGGFAFGSSNSNAGSTGGSIFGGISGTPSTPATPAATTSSASMGLGGGLFGQKPTGFTFGGTSTGPVTTASAFSLSFNKPAASATLFTLPVTSTSSGGLPPSSTVASVPATAGLWQGSAGLTLGAGTASAVSSSEGLGGIDFSSSTDKKNKNLGTTTE